MANNKATRRLGGLRKNQQFLYIGVFTVVAVMIWVGGSIFQSQRKTGISRELQQMALPLNPNINTFAIDRIEQKKEYQNDELEDFEIFVINIEAQNEANSSLPASAQPTTTPVTLGDLATESATTNPTPPPTENSQ